MKIKLRKDASAPGTNAFYEEYIKKNRGKWLEVETDHLFNDQYNTKEARIMDTDIDAVKDDARIGKGKCRYCGSMLTYRKTGLNQCIKHKECREYGMFWFLPENTFFLKYPNGIPMPGKDALKDIEYPNEKKFGSYRLEKSTYCDEYVLRNCRKTIRFKFDGTYFYVRETGYTQMRLLKAWNGTGGSVPADICLKVKKYLASIIEKPITKKNK